MAHAVDHAGHEGYDEGVVFLGWVEACRFAFATYLSPEQVKNRAALGLISQRNV